MQPPATKCTEGRILTNACSGVQIDVEGCRFCVYVVLLMTDAFCIYFSIAIHKECRRECHVCDVLQPTVAGHHVFVSSQFPECCLVYNAYP